MIITIAVMVTASNHKQEMLLCCENHQVIKWKNEPHLICICVIYQGSLVQSADTNMPLNIIFTV